MSDATTTAPLTSSLLGLAGLFTASGTIHLVRPQIFEPLVPRALPRPREIVYASGVAELACAAGLLHPRTRRVAGLASAALLVGVLPGNVQMSATAAARAGRRPTTANRAAFAATLARLPLQWPLIRIALRAARRPGRR